MPASPYARPAAAPAPAPQPKSLQAFRSISEVADILQVPQHVLRFWESKFAQIKPLKRRGGRRYYRLSDIELLCGVHKLLYSDRYTIEGVQKVLAQRGLRFVADIGRGALSIDGGSIAVETEAADANAPGVEAPAEEPEEAPFPPSPPPAEAGQGGQPLGGTARQRLLQALDTLEEIAADMQAQAALPPEDGAPEGDTPGGETPEGDKGEAP